jgi:hypothetical protein
MITSRFVGLPGTSPCQQGSSRVLDIRERRADASNFLIVLVPLPAISMASPTAALAIARWMASLRSTMATVRARAGVGMPSRMLGNDGA